MEFVQVFKEKLFFGEFGSFFEEYINVYNNIGMFDFDFDNFDVVCKIFMKGLKICDEEEVKGYDVICSRFYYNFGNVYLELRSWKEVKEYIKMDIKICYQISYC